VAFSVEHVGILVPEPLATAAWYQRVLGFEVLCSAEDAKNAVAFVCDAGHRVVLELGRVGDIEPLAARTSHHLQLHVALASDDPERDAAYLVEHGARFIERCPVTRTGDLLVVVEDPWGICIQLAKRAEGRSLLPPGPPETSPG